MLPEYERLPDGSYNIIVGKKAKIPEIPANMQIHRLYRISYSPEDQCDYLTIYDEGHYRDFQNRRRDRYFMQSKSNTQKELF